MSIGQAFYHKRNSLRIGQLEACGRAQVSYDTWNRIETEHRNRPRLETLERMAQALGCRIEIRLVDERTGEEIE